MKYCFFILLISWRTIAQTQLPDSVLEVEQTRLQFFQQNPFDINQVTLEELHALPFLTEVQLASFLNHRNAHGPFSSIHELQVVEGWDIETLRKTVGLLICNSTGKKW